MRGENFVQFALRAQDFAGRDLDVRRLSLRASQRLVDHHARMRQRRTLARRTGREQHCAHRGGQPRADRRHVAVHQLHRVVDAQTGRNRSARRIDVELDVLLRIGRFQEEQLRLDDVGRIVVDRRPEEDDAVHHQAGEDVHRGDVQLALLDDRGRHVVGDDGSEIVQPEAADAAMLDGVFFEFGRHDCTFNMVLHRCSQGFSRSPHRRGPATDQKKDSANITPAESKVNHFSENRVLRTISPWPVLRIRRRKRPFRSP